MKKEEIKVWLYLLSTKEQHIYLSQREWEIVGYSDPHYQNRDAIKSLKYEALEKLSELFAQIDLTTEAD